MRELSLNILDVVENSIAAQATTIDIGLTIDEAADSLEIFIGDNGKGMTEEQLSRVCDPFYTTRTTRGVGLGVSLFKLAAEMSGGHFEITSTVGVGTKVIANFKFSHIDRVPIGDMQSTLCTLIFLNPTLDFIYNEKVNKAKFILDTTELRAELGDVPLNDGDVTMWIKEYITENSKIQL